MNKIILAVVITTLAACGGSKEEKTPESGTESLSGNISIDGSSTVYPISEAVAEEFRKEAPSVKVTVGLSGTGGGFKKFSRGEIDINDASRTIKEEEMALCKEHNIDYIELEVGYDGLVVVVHPQNNWVNEITVAELKKIWEPEAQGKIKYWNQIRPEWPKEEIHLYGAGVESGTYDYFTEAIVGKSHSSRGDYTGSEDDNVLVQGVSGDKNSLGFFGLAYFEENKAKLKAVAVDDQNDANGKGGILPSVETVLNKSYAPLSRPLFIYVNSKAVQRPEVIRFVDFYLASAPELTKAVGFVPLRPEEYKAQQDKFAQYHSSKK
ncbi:MAG: PstS family phosphate ABC transporter substrate-binding protein [Bacteroidia bacterium]|nr:PstS family phosphate ABC transporter substrate-binding protein [Bacteroidia bacterium]